MRETIALICIGLAVTTVNGADCSLTRIGNESFADTKARFEACKVAAAAEAAKAADKKEADRKANFVRPARPSDACALNWKDGYMWSDKQRVDNGWPILDVDCHATWKEWTLYCESKDAKDVEIDTVKREVKDVWFGIDVECYDAG